MTRLVVHSRFAVGRVDPRIFGGFLEHMGRAVYEGVYDPLSGHADKEGFRKDVLAALRRLNMTAMRYPGGNFASGYHWLDGVGPREQRPTVRELAWQSVEPNRVGTDEFMGLSRKMGWTPMLTVNLGTGTPEEARNWVEYCNSPAGTLFADMRGGNGNSEPFNVGLWCLGNEMDGPWQLGHVPAEQYAIRAQQAAKMMRDTDRTIELVACGSCTTGLPTYMEWDRVVLEYLGDQADYISLHRYAGNLTESSEDYLAIGKSIDQQIEEMDSVCRYVQARRRANKRAYLCFDEWNVWYKNQHMDGAGKFAPHLIEEVYNLEDALVVAGFLNSFIRHADVVKIANMAQIVNVIAPIMTRGDEHLLQSTFYPFEMLSGRRDGVSLQVLLEGPTYESKSYGVVPLIDASVIMGSGVIHCFLVNRSTSIAQEVEVALADGRLTAVVEGEIVSGSDPKAINTFESPELVRSIPYSEGVVKNGKVLFKLPPLSLLAVTVSTEGGSPTRHSA